jgi:hypothetical protein
VAVGWRLVGRTWLRGQDLLADPQALTEPAGLRGARGGVRRPVTLSDYSPLRLAFLDEDTRFMSAQVGGWLGGSWRDG